MSPEKGQKQDKKLSYHIKSAVWLLTAVVILIVCGWFLMRGNVTKVGGNPDSVSSDAIYCKTSELRYPYIEKKDGEVSYILKADMVYKDGNINIIELNYDVEYLNEQKAEEALELVTSEFNTRMDTVGVDKSFISNVKYAKNDKHVIVSIYAHREEMIGDNAKLLLIYDDSVIGSREYLIRNYEARGFSCQEKN